MQQFDENYLSRREKQIRDIHEGKATSRIFLVLSVGFTVASFASFGANLAWLGVTLAIAAVFMWMGTTITLFISQANQAAEREIQREREQVLQMMAARGEKAKRTEYTLSDDGELVPSEETETVKKSGSRS